MPSIDLTRFGLTIVPDPPDPQDPEQRDGIIETNGSMRLTPEFARAFTGGEPSLAGMRCRITLRFDMFFTEAWPRTDENDVLKAWDMKFRGSGKVDCEMGQVTEKLEERDENIQD